MKDEPRGWVNYQRWYFLVKDYAPTKLKRLFPLLEFWKHLLTVTLLYWLHDYPIWQVCSIIFIHGLFTVAFMLIRPSKTHELNLMEFIYILPLTSAYGFTFFSLSKELALLRWGIRFRYFLVGFGVVISLWVAWVLVLSRVFFFTFTGLWEWGNKVTEKCRGAETAQIVSHSLFNF